jgi:hypothetical protein
MKQVKAFHYNLKEVYDFASGSLYDIISDGVDTGLNLAEIVSNKKDFEQSMRDGYAPMILPYFGEIEECAEDEDQFILIIWKDDKVWTVINGEDIVW